jgi:hypothetical protein
VRRHVSVQSHLALVIGSSVALACTTAYFLLVLPRPLEPGNPEWLRAAASWSTAFAAQCMVFLAVVCPVAAHALSGRWSWSVRIFSFVSAYLVLIMATMAVNSYQDAANVCGHVRSLAEL